MTERKGFKRRVRARMAKTGERYTAARAQLLGSGGGADAAAPAAPAEPERPMSDAAIARRTGRGWHGWFAILDAWGAAERPHREIAGHLREAHGLDGWSAQGVAVGYEQARGLRARHEHADGYAVSATRTIAARVDAVFAAVVDADGRTRWLPDGALSPRTLQPGKSARFDWEDGATRVQAYFTPKGGDRSTVTVQHERLPDADAAERMKAYWRAALGRLKAELER